MDSEEILRKVAKKIARKLNKRGFNLNSDFPLGKFIKDNLKIHSEFEKRKGARKKIKIKKILGSFEGYEKVDTENGILLLKKEEILYE